MTTGNAPSIVGAERRLDLPFDQAVDRTVEALSEEGFGVLCDIDVKATLKEKIDVDRGPYRILGACNPPLAHEALEEAPALGVLLPCNVVVLEDDTGILVQAVDPKEMLSLLPPSETLDKIATDVAQRLDRALASL